MLNRLKRVFESFQQHEVRYVVIGGIAAVLYGVPRATFETILLYRFARWFNFLETSCGKGCRPWRCAFIRTPEQRKRCIVIARDFSSVPTVHLLTWLSQIATTSQWRKGGERRPGVELFSALRIARSRFHPGTVNKKHPINPVKSCQSCQKTKIRLRQDRQDE